MDLRHAIPELRKLIQFFKPLIQADTLLKELLEFEQVKEKTINEIEVLESTKQKLENVIKETSTVLQDRKIDETKALNEINLSIEREKKKVSAEWDAKILVKKNEFDSLFKESIQLNKDIGDLVLERDKLTAKIAELKSVFTRTEDMVGKV